MMQLPFGRFAPTLVSVESIYFYLLQLLNFSLAAIEAVLKNGIDDPVSAADLDFILGCGFWATSTPWRWWLQMEFVKLPAPLVDHRQPKFPKRL